MKRQLGGVSYTAEQGLDGVSYAMELIPKNIFPLFCSF